mgnify:CR=1 FL=1
MSRVAPHTVRVAVVGDGRVADAFAEWDDGVAVESVDPAAVDDPEFDGADCVVVDGRVDGIDAVEAAGRVAQRPECAPAVALTDGWDGEHVAAAVSAGVADTLPRALVNEDPDALVGSVVDDLPGLELRGGVRDRRLVGQHPRVQRSTDRPEVV